VAKKRNARKRVQENKRTGWSLTVPPPQKNPGNRGLERGHSKKKGQETKIAFPPYWPRKRLVKVQSHETMPKQLGGLHTNLDKRGQ